VNILVTGLAGFIGSHLGTRLLERGDRVIGLDNFDETLYPARLHRQNLAALPLHPRLRFVEGDLCNRGLVHQLVSEERPDVVVHLAALAGVRPSLQQPERYIRVNLEGTATLLEACRQAGVRRVVFASSSSVYGAHPPVPFREDDPALRPASPYAATKRAGELLGSNWVDLYGIGFTALRFFTVYGPRQRPEMAIAKFARLLLRDEPIPLFGDGTSARDYTYVDDIIDGVVASIDQCTPGRFCTYNLGGSRTTSLAQLVELLEAGLGRRARIERHPDQAGDVPITSADVSLAARELGYAPQVSIEEGLRRVCAWLTTDGSAHT
jgi:UDP-glucuronate 4-epimerase